MKRLILLSISVYAFFLSNLHAQNAQLDSLRGFIEKESSSTIDRFNRSLTLSRQYFDYDVEVSKNFTRLATQYAKSMDSIALGKVYIMQSEFHQIRNDIDSADLVVDLSEICLNANSNKKYEMLLLRERAGILQKQGAHDEALQLFHKVSSYYDSIDQKKELAKTYVASIRSRVLSQSNTENKTFLKSAWDLVVANQQDSLNPELLYNMGEVHRRLGELPEAMEHFIEGIQLADAMRNRRSKMKGLNGMATLYGQPIQKTSKTD